MEKLQYDSFYKFLVSLGVILVALPLIAMAFVANRDIILISQGEYEALSSYSQQAIQQRQVLYNFISAWLPLMAKILIPMGVLLILVGCVRWFIIQLQLDDQIRSDTIMKKINAQKMSAAEIAVKAIEEVSVAEACDTEDNSPEESADTSARVEYTQGQNALWKYIEIENLCFNSAVKEYSKNYHLKKNIRVGSCEYDFVAVSKKDNIDLLFEVKYWRRLPPDRILTQLLYKLYSMGVNYENIAHRNFRVVLTIVSPKQQLQRLKERTKELFAANVSYDLDVRYIAEEELIDKHDRTEKNDVSA